MKFVRRRDLTSDTRVSMAVEAYQHRRSWGYLSDLARRYDVSRQFIYMLLWTLTELFEPEEPTPERAKGGSTIEVSVDRLMLAMRLPGCCSGGDITAVFKLMGIPGSSIGRVSERLRSFARAIPNTLPAIKHPVIVLVDETFSKGTPIFVVIDARSHYVLKAVWMDRRDGGGWKDMLDELKNHGYDIVMVVADQGSAIRAGVSAAGYVHFPDLMHLLHPFGPFLSRYERKAIAAIENEDERLRVAGNAKSERNMLKRMEQYGQAVQAADKAMRLHDDYAYLWRELVGAFDPFNHDGSVRTPVHAEAEIGAIMELMETGFDDKGLRAAAKSLRKALGEYLPYFERVVGIVAKFSQIVPEDALRELCLSWQNRMKARNTKDYARRGKFDCKAEERLALAECAGIEGFHEIAGQLFERFEGNVRSSSPIESINSRIRDFLNSSRGQITQETLDMIVYFINHNIAPRGRFRGTSAWQRLTGETEEGTFLDQLMDFQRKDGDGSGISSQEGGEHKIETMDLCFPFPVPCSLEKTG